MRVRGMGDGLTKCDSEQARAKQHEARSGYREKSVSHIIMFMHGAPADQKTRRCELPAATERPGTPHSQKISRGPTNWNPIDDLEQHPAGIQMR
jgi:hypothetical protein